MVASIEGFPIAYERYQDILLDSLSCLPACRAVLCSLTRCKDLLLYGFEFTNERPCFVQVHLNYDTLDLLL